MVSNALNALDKIGEFINKYTGSGYNYTEPSGEISPAFQQVGEVFGIPVWVDTGKAYENEFLDFPSLGDILQSIANTGVSVETNFTKCTACMTVTYAIPLITYPPITVCLENPQCKEKEEEPVDDRPCYPSSVYDDHIRILNDTFENWDNETSIAPNFPAVPTKPLCPRDDEPPLIPPGPVPGEPGQVYKWRWRFTFADSTGDVPTTYSPWRTIRAGEYWNPYEYPPQQSGSKGIFGAIFTNWEWSYQFDAYSRGPTGSTYFSHAISWNIWNGGGSKSYWSKATSTIEFDEETPSPYQDPRPNPTPKPVPIPDPVIPMDKCCDDVKKILARIEKVLKECRTVLNPDQFEKKECQMPKNWIYPTNDPSPEYFEDYPDFLAGIARLVDRRLGSMPQIIKVKDADPTKEGDQEVNLVVNTVSDLNKLTLEYLIAAQGEVGATQLMLSSILHEVGITHQLSVVNERALKAIIEFLDFELAEKAEKFKMYFNPKAQRRDNEALAKYLSRVITPHEQAVEIQEWAGGQSLKDKLNEIIKKVSIAAGAVSTTKDFDKLVDEQIQLNRLERLVLIKEIQDRTGMADLKTYFDDAEKGFPSSERSAQVKEKPYGFKSKEEPKFKQTTKGSRKRRYKKIKDKNGN
jgi:hypothetical protein